MNTHSQEEFERRLNEIWMGISKDKVPENNPQAYVLGGQPGAGKSGLTKQIENKLNNNAITINGDDFRKFHKHYDDFQKKYGQEASKYTAEFAGKATEQMIQKAVENRYNIIIEGTFRTKETPLRTLQGLKDKGYEAHVAIQTCPKRLSLLSTKSRYFIEEHINKGYGRLTPEDNHNLTASTLAQNAEAVYKANIADSFYVQSREGVIYDSTKTDRPFTANLIQKELDRYPIREVNEMKAKHFKEFPKEVTCKIFPALEAAYKRQEELFKKIDHKLSGKEKRFVENEITNNIADAIKKNKSLGKAKGMDLER